MNKLNQQLANAAVSRRSVLAGLAAAGSAAILGGCSGSGASGSSAAAAGTFKIGMIGPLTGAVASFGTMAANGAELACKDFSDETYSFEIKKEDDQADGEKATNAFNTLADWGMQALVGPVTTGACVSVAEEANKDPKVLLVTPSASSLDVTDGKDCVFQVCFTDPNLGSSSADFLNEKYSGEKLALFYNSGDAYSSGVADAFKQRADELGVEIVDEETFKDDSQTSFNNQLTKAQAAGATLIFAPIYYTPASVLLTNAHDMGYNVKLMGCDGMDGILDVEGFDPAYAEGVLLVTPFSADEEKNKSFVDAYQAAYGEVPSQFAADGYDCVHAISEALRHAKLSADVDAAEAAAKLSEAMREIEFEGLTGTLSWDSEGHVEKPATAYVIQNGKYVKA